MSNKQINIPNLTRDEVVELAKALATILKTRENKIVTKESEATTAAAERFLSCKLREHASEFLGTWFACNDEYTPLIAAFKILQRRATGFGEEKEEAK